MKKPFKSYNGGKESDGSYQKIISVMPQHDIYIEAFLGNGAIFRKKKPANITSIGIDLDTAVINKWRETDYPLYLINTDAISWLEHFQVLANILKNFTDIKVLIYLDPPYPKECRKSDKDLYLHEMNDAAHTKLLDVARSIHANVVISSYPNIIYDRILSDWNSFTFQAQTRSGTATEKVWYNFTTPTELHDYRYLGNDYRQRERIKGIISRGISKFKRMPDPELNALIYELKHQGIIN